MRSAISTMRTAILLLSCLGGVLVARTAPAQTIGLKLNVFFTNPADEDSGGTWEVVARSSHSGISGISALLTNVTTAQSRAPRGTVNGSDEAGFGLFHNTLNPLGFRNITVGQVPLPTIGLGEEQTVFYGVGTLTNGAPNYPGKPAGTNSIGPAFSTLTVPAMNSGIPWATGDAFGDPAWNTAAKLAGGTFPAGLTPGFFSNEDYRSSGNVFTTVGTSMTPGTISLAAISTVVRTNLSAGPALPDYNDNGFVDAADYALWRNTRGQNGPNLAADGNNDGTVNQADYDLWRTHFGKTVPPGSGAALTSTMVAVPEPTSGILLALGALGLAWQRRRAR
jgi:PEP-CTERM motif-containing protein/dockerin type I repeat protein